PTDYVPEAGVDGKTAARCRFGKTSRFGANMTDGPGPCQYSPRDPNSTSERITISTRTSWKLPTVSTVTPGPGAYSPRKASETLKQGTSFSRGASRWASGGKISPGMESPGPAGYQLDPFPTRKANPCGFGSSQRMADTGSSSSSNVGTTSLQTPGPGSYSWDLKPFGPKVSMTPRREEY
ncbi:unnamed protein product, partial [Polarella glacialis]